MFSRREMLAASAMGAAMTVSAANAGSFGNPDEPPQGSINAKNPGSVTDPGPQNPRVRLRVRLRLRLRLAQMKRQMGSRT